MKFGEPINENRPPETSAEKHFAYLNSQEGETEFNTEFGGNPIRGLSDSRYKERTDKEKNEITERIKKFTNEMGEVLITSEVIHDLISGIKVNKNSSYLLILSKIKEIISKNDSGSINSQLLIEKATIAKNYITELRDRKIISNDSNLTQIIEILQKKSNELNSILEDLRRKLSEL